MGFIAELQGEVKEETVKGNIERVTKKSPDNIFSQVSDLGREHGLFEAEIAIIENKRRPANAIKNGLRVGIHSGMVILAAPMLASVTPESAIYYGAIVGGVMVAVDLLSKIRGRNKAAFFNLLAEANEEAASRIIGNAN